MLNVETVKAAVTRGIHCVRGKFEEMDFPKQTFLPKIRGPVYCDTTSKYRVEKKDALLHLFDEAIKVLDHQLVVEKKEKLEWRHPPHAIIETQQNTNPPVEKFLQPLQTLQNAPKKEGWFFPKIL